MNSYLYYAGLLAGVLSILVASGPSSFATITEPAQPPGTTDQSPSTEEGIVTVAIGEGSNDTIQHYTYTPQSVEINAGDSVTWYSPSAISDIHTVTFVGDPNIVSDIILPFAVPSGATEFQLLPPFNQGEPLIVPAPDGREAIVALNKNAWYPALIGVNNQTTYFNGTDIEVTLNSTLKAVNSGIIVPAMPTTSGDQANSTETGTTGGEQIMGPPFPPVNSFTVTFQEPGTYPYFCAIHPWMHGQVVVRGEAPSGTVGQNQTGTVGQNEAPNPIFE